MERLFGIPHGPGLRRRAAADKNRHKKAGEEIIRLGFYFCIQICRIFSSEKVTSSEI